MTHLPENQPKTHPAATEAQQPALRRRQWLGLGVGATAAIAGAGLAWWRLQPQTVGAGAAQAFWSMGFEDIEGQVVAMAPLRGQPLLLNFWATWCPPCVQELPLLNRFHQAHREKGWNVVALAIDQPANVRKFLQRMPLDVHVVLGGLPGSDLGRALGNDRGGLPYSVLFGADGGILQRKIGQVTSQDLQDWAQNLQG